MATPTSKDGMQHLFYRIASFRKLGELTNARPLSLTRAGFYWNSNREIVCHECGTDITDDIHSRQSVSLRQKHQIGCSMLKTELVHSSQVSRQSTNMCTGQDAHPNDLFKEMESKTNRLQSFKVFPGYPCREDVLAEAGFFYNKPRQIIQCPYCAVVLQNWETHYDPFEEHRLLSSACKFLNGRDLKSFKDISAKTPKFPRMSKRRLRRMTFSNPKMLHWATAGFFCKDDQSMQCFFCGLVVRLCAATGEPWGTHMELFPHCSHAKEGARQQEKPPVPPDKLIEVYRDDSQHEVSDSESEDGVSCQTRSANHTTNVKEEASGGREIPTRSCPSCLICGVQGVEAFLIPCHHAVCCVGCAPEVHVCPICSIPVSNFYRIYM